MFGNQLKAGLTEHATVTAHPTSTCLNGDFGFQTWHHNFVVSFPKMFSNFYLLGLDFVARGDALPEPGVGPEAELHAYPCGTMEWLDKQLQPLSLAPAANDTRFFLMQHHPFHNRDVLDPFGKNREFNFTFDDKQVFFKAKKQIVFIVFIFFTFSTTNIKFTIGRVGSDVAFAVLSGFILFGSSGRPHASVVQRDCLYSIYCS